MNGGAFATEGDLHYISQIRDEEGLGHAQTGSLHDRWIAEKKVRIGGQVDNRYARIFLNLPCSLYTVHRTREPHIHQH